MNSLNPGHRGPAGVDEAQAAAAREAELGKSRLLIVDDEESVALTVSEVLRRDGHLVDMALAGDEAIRKLKSTHYDLVLTDLHMEGTDGIAVLAEARHRSPFTITIVLTGFASLESAIAAMRQGAYDYLIKPCIIEDMQQTVRRGLEHRRLKVAEAEGREKLQSLNAELHKQVAELAAVNARLQDEITEHERAKESLRQLSGRILQVQDEERRRLGRDLHDTTGQALAALEVNLSLLGQSCPDGLSEKCRKLLQDCSELARECSREIRTVSYLLYPPVLEELGLAATLRSYVEGYRQRSGIQVVMTLPEKASRLARDMELALFRIVQESLANVHRHSGSPSAEVHIQRTENQLVLEVKDKGRGISKQIAEGLPEDASLIGVGLAGIRERIRQLGGRFEIHSSDQGTTVRAILPLK
jgi:signal transduction histidine kinase